MCLCPGFAEKSKYAIETCCREQAARDRVCQSRKKAWIDLQTYWQSSFRCLCHIAIHCWAHSSSRLLHLLEGGGDTLGTEQYIVSREFLFFSVIWLYMNPKMPTRTMDRTSCLLALLSSSRSTCPSHVNFVALRGFGARRSPFESKAVISLHHASHLGRCGPSAAGPRLQGGSRTGIVKRCPVAREGQRRQADLPDRLGRVQAVCVPARLAAPRLKDAE